MCKNKQYQHSFVFNDTATTEIYTLSLHDALPIFLNSLLFIGISQTLGSICERVSLYWTTDILMAKPRKGLVQPIVDWSITPNLRILIQ